MFLYQLVNLVLETCFIFSKTLKLSKTFVLGFSFLFVIRTTSVMIPLFQIFLGIDFKKVSFLEYLGLFYEVNCGVDLGFLTHLRKMFELLTRKRSHNF